LVTYDRIETLFQTNLKAYHPTDQKASEENLKQLKDAKINYNIQILIAERI
jgi:hypothetical protein